MIQKATFVKASETGGKAEVELWNAKGVKLGMATFVYTLQSNGALKVKTTFCRILLLLLHWLEWAWHLKCRMPITRFLIWDVVNMKLYRP